MIEKREAKELVVELHHGLCFNDFGRVVTSLLEDLLYRTSHLELPIKHIGLVCNELTPRNRVHFERLKKVLNSIEHLASTGTLAEVVLLQGSTVPLAQSATHIQVEAAPWDDNTPCTAAAMRESLLQMFRAVTSVDLQAHAPNRAKCFLFVRMLPSAPKRIPTVMDLNEEKGRTQNEQKSTESPTTFACDTNKGETSLQHKKTHSNIPLPEGFERRAGLPLSRTKNRTIFRLCQQWPRNEEVSNEVCPSSESTASEVLSQERTNEAGVWMQLSQHLPTVSCSS